MWIYAEIMCERVICPFLITARDGEGNEMSNNYSLIGHAQT